MSDFARQMLAGGLAEGWTRYEDGEDPSNPRIVVQARLRRDGPSFDMILDTGSTWNVLHPEILEASGLPAAGEPRLLRSWRGVLRGNLLRSSLILPALEGEEALIDGTFFAPHPDDVNDDFPNFLGYIGGLERVRFAVDPRDNVLCLGSYRG